MFARKVARGWRAFIVIAVIMILLTPAWQASAQTEPLPDLTLDTQLGFTNGGKDDHGNCVGKLRITIKNKGSANAGTFVVAFTLGQVLYSVTVQSLQNGASTTITPDVVVPVGTHLLRLMADATRAVREGNEVNNSWAQYVTCAGAAR